MENLLVGSEWEIIQEDFKEKRAHYETLFALSNGHFGTRGTLEEGGLFPAINEKEGSYINGFYETNPIIYGENAYGYAKNAQTICHVPDGNSLSFALNGQWFDGSSGTLSNHKRVLDMKEGTLTRSFDWETETNEKASVRITRLVSYAFPSVSVVHYEIEPLDFDGYLEFKSMLANRSEPAAESEKDDPRVAKRGATQYAIKKLEHKALFLHCLTHNSNLEIVCTQSVVHQGEAAATYFQEGSLRSYASMKVEKNKKVSFDVYNYYSNTFQGEGEAVKQADLAVGILAEATQAGFGSLLALQRKHFAKFWEDSDVAIEGDALVQKGLRFNLFHLNQAAGRDGLTNIAAKGLTGDGYEGHYFWDTEMYMLPFFIFTNPDLARALLRYRHAILGNARNRALELGMKKGALFAWRTINGEECSAYYPAGTAQVHINADIAYGVQTYVEATNDRSFMLQEGLEILVETARFWLEFGDYIPEKDNQFCINGVTGPDEYTALVNNNYYTNVMAKNNLAYAASVATIALDDEASQPLIEKLAVTAEEVEAFKKAAAAMYLPFDSVKQLTKQDDTFLEKARWPFEETPKENYPLLLHYHPMIIYKYQVNKQADVVLAHFLMGSGIDKQQIERDFHYYEAITTHDSSLSRSIFGAVASAIGLHEKAYDYFMDTALMDLTDYQGNTADGIHAANMGGSWLSIVFGFAGMRLHAGQLSFDPHLPDRWDSLTFKVQFHDSTIQITMNRNNTVYEVINGEETVIYHQTERIALTEGIPRFVTED